MTNDGAADSYGVVRDHDGPIGFLIEKVSAFSVADSCCVRLVWGMPWFTVIGFWRRPGSGWRE